MNWIFSKHRRALRKARRKGKLHGKANHPHEKWGDDPVPYLQILKAQGDKKIQELENQLRNSQGQVVTLTEEEARLLVEIEEEIAQLAKESSDIKVEVEKLELEKKGLDNENPVSKAARIRVVSLPLYWAALLMLSVGEFLVTLPAVEKILNDANIKGILITASFSFLSIICAHLIGMTLKMQTDRNNPQPRWQIWGIVVLAIFVSIVVLLLSAIRSDSVQSAPFTFGLSMTAFGTLLFFVVQMSFVLAALALSYFNHAEIEVQLDRAKRREKKIKRQIKSLNRKKMTIGRHKMTPEKAKIQMEALCSAGFQLEAQYRELCAEYRGANLLAQAEAMGGGVGSGGLQEQPLTRIRGCDEK